MPTTMPRGSSADFDFMLGTWRSRQRRLRQRLAGCTAWDTFEATTHALRLPGGLVQFDTLVAEAWRPGWVGMSLRCFNAATGLWSIHWLTNEGAGLDAETGRLDPPVVGGFMGDEGLFEGHDLVEGRPVRVRFRWLRQGPDHAHWEQAFSADGGHHWEVNWTMDFERLADQPVLQPLPDLDPQVLELRRYTLHPGRRDKLIDLFDTYFIEPQEAQGMVVIGQFRDEDAPDRFVWLRGFADMATRAAALAGFYDGPVWRQHRDRANATMVDSDDVLLLRPAWPGAGLPLAGLRRAAGPVRMAPPQQVMVSVFPLREAATPELLALCRERLAPRLRHAGVVSAGWYVSELADNTFARLPVRRDVQVLVRVVVWPGVAGAAEPLAPASLQPMDEPLQPWLAAPPQHHRLLPTARSALGHAGAAADAI